MQWTKGDTVVNMSGRVVKYTLSGLVPHSQHIVRVTADSPATDTVPEGLAQLRSLNITLRTLPDGKGTYTHVPVMCTKPHFFTKFP